MAEGSLMLLAAVSCFSGMAWLALAKAAHWRQVRPGASQAEGARRGLQVAGSLALLLALWLCLLVDAPTMAALVWCMLLSVSAAAVAFTLSWRPHWLRLWLLRRG